jgi:hypothetical protein
MAIINNGSVLKQGNPNDLIAGLQGRIGRKQIKKQELDGYKRDHRVISSQFITGHLNIHIMTDMMPAGFQPIDPTLEDVYFSILNQHSN